MISSNNPPAQNDQKLQILIRIEEITNDIGNADINLMLGLQKYISQLTIEMILDKQQI